MASKVYKVREGDTVLSICLSHRISWETFATLNHEFDSLGHRNHALLQVGELLVVGTDPIDLVKG